MRVLDTSGTVHAGHNPGSIARRLYGRDADVVPVEVRTGVLHRWEVVRGTTYVTDLYPHDEN